eukprot:TRINITY_DN4998_c0_g1_i2.p1 TRINITY_DN4998_c0_g1~~TRINITY_DN4998_c0_g1_i2.p1  ORF type:complete len:228 (+),score=52.68 TRINITY_DN4998_c0_g1_i2:483-1166(+)
MNIKKTAFGGNNNFGFSNNNNNNERNNNGFNSNNSANFHHHNNEQEGEEIAAPPTSSAADLIARLEQEQEAFVDPNQVQRIESNNVVGNLRNLRFNVTAKSVRKYLVKNEKLLMTQRVDDDALKAKRNSNSAEIEKELRRRKEKKNKWKNESSMLRQAIQASRVMEKAIKEGKSLADIPIFHPLFLMIECRVLIAAESSLKKLQKRHIPKMYKNIKAKTKGDKKRNK